MIEQEGARQDMAIAATQHMRGLPALSPYGVIVRGVEGATRRFARFEDERDRPPGHAWRAFVVTAGGGPTVHRAADGGRGLSAPTADAPPSRERRGAPASGAAAPTDLTPTDVAPHRKARSIHDR
jgi:hypothetical protein